MVNPSIGIEVSLLKFHFACLYTGIVAVTLWSICMWTLHPDLTRTLLKPHRSNFYEAYICPYHHHRAICSLDNSIRGGLVACTPCIHSIWQQFLYRVHCDAHYRPLVESKSTGRRYHCRYKHTSC